MPPTEDDRPPEPGAEQETKTLTGPGARGATGAPAGFTFSPDEIVAGRFRIVRFVGQGGMGEVYEAVDVELNEHMALKTIRPEIASDERIIARFKHEIQLARKVTHPNVCRVFDVFHHRRETGGEITFLTMELLQGESLAERLRRQGRMPTAEALPIVSQLTAALAAAHGAGVVHRDLKSGNIILVRSPGQESLRAVVTDFGLARSLAAGDGAATITTTGEIAGTPAYMAPEQLEGGKVTEAVDIYALGIILYEMVTGALPFAGESPLAVAVKRLQEPPPSPRTRVPNLDPRWEAAILRCLERNPRDRFANAADVLKTLGGEEPVRRRDYRLGAVFLLLFLLAVVAGYYLSSPRGAGERAKTERAVSPVRARRSVAVLGFRNLSRSSSAAWLSTAFSEMLTTELAAGEDLRTIPGENVARMKTELMLADADSFAQDTLSRIRQNLGTDVVVVGSYVVLGEGAGDKIRLDLRLQDAVKGETIAAVSDTGTQAELLEIVARTGSRLREKLGVGGLTTAQAGKVRAALPANLEAARLYSEGLTKLRLFDAKSALDLLEKAAKADPRHVLTHSALAAAWSALGYDGKARKEVETALELAANLPREDRLSIEARYCAATRQWAKAAEIYRTLWNFFPDNLEYGLRMAEVQTSGASGKDALVTIEALRKLPPPARDDPRVDLAEASAARDISDNKRAKDAAARAATKGTALGARLLVARARFEEGSALQNLGEMAKAAAALEEARQLYSAASDQRGAASALNNIALVLINRGDLAGAKRMFEDALKAYREVGNQSGVALALSNLGNICYMQGDLAGARKMWRQTLATYREIGEQEGVARMLNNIASSLASQGDLAGASKIFAEALEAFRATGNKNGMAVAMDNIGMALHSLGDPLGAKKLIQDALVIWRETGDKTYASSTLSSLGDVHLTGGDFSEARKCFEEALLLRAGMGAKGDAAASRLDLARLSLEEARFAPAETAAREAIGEFRALKDADGEASTDAVLARSLLAQGRTLEARKAIDSAGDLSRRSQNLSLRLGVAITSARVRAASGKASEALGDLQTVLAESTRAGLVSRQLEARLAIAETEAKFTDRDAGYAHLQEVEKEANSRGFRLLARQAGAARQR